MKSVELFCGAGGLALGVSGAGFEHVAVVEIDQDACDTLRENQRRGFHPVSDWPLFESDVRKFDYSSIQNGIDLLAGGPPCQPFSLGGKHKAYNDRRDMFPEAIRAVRELKPRAFIFENVRGLARPAFFNYFQYVCLQLEFIEMTKKKKESWEDHSSRLQEAKASGKHRGLNYRVLTQLINAANYGIPQRRERIFVVGFRDDLDIEWSFPNPTHDQDSLIASQWITGEYWDFHRVAKKRRPSPSPATAKRVERLTREGLDEKLGPWLTVRDAISDLPNPVEKRESFPNHRFQPGARAYPGHTGSVLDEPAKTLKAGDHGVPGGENMLVMNNGTIRYFTVRESARLQTFPDDFIFHGSWTETMRQLGNAVPVALAETISKSVARGLREFDEKRKRI